MADRYGIYCASFAHDGGTLNLQQLDNQGMTAGSRSKMIRPGGALSPHAHILSTANPVARFQTCDYLTIQTVLGANFGLFCSGGHVMRYQKRLEGGAFQTGSSHHIQSTARGFLHITSLEVDIDSDEGVSANLEYIPLSIAGENPIVDLPSQSFAAVAVPAFISQYFMGGCYLGAVQALGLKRVNVRPGIIFGTNRSDGGVFCRSDASSILAYNPAIELRYLNIGIATAIGSFFQNVLSAPINIYFQRGTQAADGRIAAATSAHGRVTATAGSWGQDDITVAGEQDGMTTVRVMPVGQLVPTLNVALGA